MSNSHRSDSDKATGSHHQDSHPFEQSRDAARQAMESIEANPMSVLLGGLAVGAIAAALIPRSGKERELLAPIGKRISTTATAAFAAARESGKAELEARGLSRDGARDQARQLLEGVAKAMASAGQAGVDAARGKSV